MKNTVIASQCAHWRGNPPVRRNRVTITTKTATPPSFRLFIYTLPSNRGIATPACALVRNDSSFSVRQTPNLSLCFRLTLLSENVPQRGLTLCAADLFT